MDKLTGITDLDLAILNAARESGRKAGTHAGSADVAIRSGLTEVLE